MTDAKRHAAPLRTVLPEPLSAAEFEPYGDVIDAAIARDKRLINEGNTTRFHDLASLDLGRENGVPLVSIFRSTPLSLPIEIKLMERHPLGSQAFVPLSGRPYLVVVAHPTPSDLKVFVADPAQGINLRAGTWHHYSLALEAPSDFLVIDRGGPGDNLEEVELEPHQRIVVNVS